MDFSIGNKTSVSQGVLLDAFVFSRLGCDVPELSQWLCSVFLDGNWVKNRATEGYCWRALSRAEFQALMVYVAPCEEIAQADLPAFPLDECC